MAQAYEDYVGLIKRQSAKYHRITGIDVTDFLSIGSEVYVDAVFSFDGRSKFSTWLGYNLDCAFQNYLRKHATASPLEYLDFVPSSVPNPEHETIFWDMLDKMSRDAKEIVAAILNRPSIFNLKTNEAPRLIRGKIRNHFLTNIGWSQPRLYRAFAEIKNTLV